MTTVALVPIKLNNERLPGKNTMPMADGNSLLDRVLRTLVGTGRFDKVVVYCSDDAIQAQVDATGAEWMERDETLDLPTATSNDILTAFAADVPADVYALVHATSPFLTPASLATGLDAVEHGGFDSALAVERLQTFVWREGRPMNYDPQRIPRTQDLDPLFVETSGFFIFERDVLTTLGRRVGDNPRLVEVSKTEAVDVDGPADMDFANALIRAGVPGTSLDLAVGDDHG